MSFDCIHIEGLVFFVSSSPSNSYIIPDSSFPGFPESKSWDLMETSILGLTVSSSLTLCIMSSYGSLNFFISAGGAFSDHAEQGTNLLNIAKCHEKSFYCYICFLLE